MTLPSNQGQKGKLFLLSQASSPPHPLGGPCHWTCSCKARTTEVWQARLVGKKVKERKLKRCEGRAHALWGPGACAVRAGLQGVRERHTARREVLWSSQGRVKMRTSISMTIWQVAHVVLNGLQTSCAMFLYKLCMLYCSDYTWFMNQPKRTKFVNPHANSTKSNF